MGTVKIDTTMSGSAHAGDEVRPDALQVRG